MYFETHTWVASAAIGFARLAPVFFILPFLNGGILSGLLRISVTMLVAVGIWPHTLERMPNFQTIDFIFLFSREVMLGLLLGFLLAWPFWVFHALGSIIDNQRGATLSSTIDPANGVDTSEMANFLNIFAAVVYLQGGGMLLVLETFRESYVLCQPFGRCMPVLPMLWWFINNVASQALVVASPVIAALLLSEVLLGLLSRFSPQMNAFAISLTVKSGIAFFIILLYFSPVLPERVMQLAFPAAELPSWLKESKKD
ncbi:type III secretion system export apparatus subunit SctT [Aeromonas cavernicola]|uniref:type III secretion system export apparatus subunit SctT n=1 Tax=Aeromonas cavernicola TaxID=1006623 RepID=UPI0023511922|nr:type III secretion system export apparatus subunit SctT [Aeromonas cavernicola]